MIRKVKAGELPSIPPSSEAAVRIRCLADAYGSDAGAFLHFWLGEGGSVVALLDGAATLLPGLDWEEAGLFVSMHPDILSLRTDADTAERLVGLLNGWTLKTGDVMSPAGSFASSPLIKALTPRDIYPVLTACFGESAPPFEGWYVDVSHRLRHGYCRIAAVEEDNRAVATAMTTAECTGGAVIGAVATLPEKRGHGHASACVCSLTADLLEEGRRVFLSPKNDRARRLYEHLGYTVIGGWGTLQRPAAATKQL